MLTRAACFAILLCISSASYADENTVLIHMDLIDGERVIYVEGEVTDLRDIDTVLHNQHRAKGRYAEVSLLFNTDLPLSDVFNIYGWLGKIGFLNVKFYILSRENHWMSEVEFSTESIRVPYDLN